MTQRLNSRERERETETESRVTSYSRRSNTFCLLFFEWSSMVSRLQNHSENTVFFLPPSLQEFLILIWSPSIERWKAESRLAQTAVLDLTSLDWESSAQSTRSLLYCSSINYQHSWNMMNCKIIMINEKYKDFKKCTD